MNRMNVGQKRKTAPNGERFALGRAHEGSEAQKSLWAKGIRCDVQLRASSNTVVSAHSTILVAWSQYFSQYFESAFADSGYASRKLSHARCKYA